MEAVFTSPYVADDTSRLPQPAPSRVLVVSDPDHANAADALRNTFESHGFEVVAVSSLADAVASAGTHTVNVAVVDLEVSRGRGRTTPGSGLDLIAALRQAEDEANRDGDAEPEQYRTPTRTKTWFNGVMSGC